MNDLIIKAMEMLNQELNELRKDFQSLMEQQHQNLTIKNATSLAPRLGIENRR
ncbi:MAG: hypothetical protein KJ990_12035 [Proteobacteria bacterium]|nr:hypothetical protein [Pseudomonadota bacterium]MBU1649859.1 hypothetical protein [Pseudomonadota bacterium]